MRHAWQLTFAITFALLPASAVAQVVPGCPTEAVNVGGGYGSGEDLHQSSERDLEMMVLGFVNGIRMSTVFGANLECVTFYDACLRGKSYTQLAAVIRQHVAETPEQWHQASSFVMFSALYGMCHQEAFGE